MTTDDFQIERTFVRDDRVEKRNFSFARSIFPGLVAAAASAGVIVGDGWRSGTSLTSFIRVGAVYFAPRLGTLLPTVLHAIVGLTIHTFWFVLWGVCFTAVARSLRGGKLFIAALIVTALLWIFARVAFPLALGAAELPLMSTAHVALYLATIAAAFSLGTRLARYA